jgi:4-hydroxy-3-methylbut-2-enyl diphosphate reductase
LQIDQVSVPDERPDVHLLLAAPRGFCAGVRRAIEAVRDALVRYGAPVYVRRAIVHNREVVRNLEREGAVFIEELAEAPPGSIVLLSAHGVAPTVANEANLRGQIAFDAVCPLVAKIHREVERHVRLGRYIVLIGHGGHPEIEGTLGHIPAGMAVLINCIEDVTSLSFERDVPLAYAIQTTYSVDDAADIVTALRMRFSDLIGPPSSDICYATTNRQAAVRLIARRSDAMIVAGERFSSNACRLAEVASAGCGSVQLVPAADELDWSLLPQTGGVIGLTAAASTPESIVDDIVAVLADRFQLRVEQVNAAEESRVFKPLAIA